MTAIFWTRRPVGCVASGKVGKQEDGQGGDRLETGIVGEEGGTAGGEGCCGVDGVRQFQDGTRAEACRFDERVASHRANAGRVTFGSSAGRRRTLRRSRHVAA